MQSGILALATLGCLSTLGAPGCKSSSNLSDIGSGSGSGSSSGVVRTDGGGSSGGQDASRPDTGASDGSVMEGSSATDAPPPDAPTNQPDGGIKGNPPPDSGFQTTCDQQLAWAATGAAFDATVTPGSLPSQVNPLLASAAASPLTLADYPGDAGGWWLRVSGTDTGGGQQQYFPAQHQPLVDVPMQRAPDSFASGSAGAGWLKVVDASQAEVWIQLDQVMATASYGDVFCQTLVNGTLAGVIDASAASVAITTSSGATTVGALLGAQNSTTPAGWTTRLTFSAQKVQVTFK